ncbi:MAG: protein-L-isoaspartate(D-aspartate) O-methyltransferase [Acidobacteriota bacterium]
MLSTPCSAPAASPATDGRCRRGRSLGLVLLTLALCLVGFEAPPSAAQTGDTFGAQRLDMVESQVRRRGVTQPSLLEAMQLVPRHRFVPETLEREAYTDRPVPIAPGQTLSQAYVSARMISLLDLDGDEKVLEIGTGSGYDAALLSRIADEVYTIEIDEDLAKEARGTLRELGYDNVRVQAGDGYRGWPSEAPFDAILMTTAPPRIPEPLFDQLAPGGKMVIAVGYSLHQDLQVVTKSREGDREVRRVSLVSLTPMTGEVQQDRDD